jgi:hypothetical protein
VEVPFDHDSMHAGEEITSPEPARAGTGR